MNYIIVNKDFSEILYINWEGEYRFAKYSEEMFPSKDSLFTYESAIAILLRYQQENDLIVAKLTYKALDRGECLEEAKRIRDTHEDKMQKYLELKKELFGK